MNKVILIITIFIFAINTNNNAQTLNQNAAWPNTDWTVSGDYHPSTVAFEADPITSSNFAYNSLDVWNHYANSIGAKSPIIDLAPAILAGETDIYVEGSFVHSTNEEHVLTLAYWDADAADWIPWINKFQNTADSPKNIYCSGPYETYQSPKLDVSSFTPTQLAGFRYLIYYNDNGESQIHVGFCFQSPTIKSIAPPLPAEITIKGNKINIPNGNEPTSILDNTHFGNTCVATTKSFQIYNEGGAGAESLNITTPVTIGGANASDFSITAQPASVVGNGLGTNIIVEFNPTFSGIRTAYITVFSDDADEGSYTFNIEGNSVVAVTDVYSVCGSYLWMDENTYIADNTTATYLKTGDGSACGDTLFTLHLTVLPLPNEEIVVAANTNLCANESTTIMVASSEEDVAYYLRDDATNDTISGPVVGTGSGISFNTGNVNSKMTYNVEATRILEETGLKFDGEDDYIELDQTLPIDSSSHTIEVWVKIPLVGTEGLDVGERVGIILGNYPNTGFISWEILNSGKVRVSWGVAPNTFDISNGSTDLRDNQWHHIAFVRNKVDNYYKVFIDGDIEWTFGNAGSDVSYDPLNKYRIGADNRPTDVPYFHGTMDHLQFWNYAKTEAEIEISISNCVYGDKPKLVHYYNFGDGVGSSKLTDVSSTGNDGVLYNFDTTNSWVDGVVNCFSCSQEMSLTPTVDVTTIDVSITDSAPILTANQVGASYKWLDCDNSNAPINGAINQSLTVAVSGNYAVEVTVDNCVDTSACMNVTGLRVQTVFTNQISVSPNPTNGLLNIETGSLILTKVEMFDIHGKQVMSRTANFKSIDISNLVNGVYFLKALSNNSMQTIKVLKR